MDIRSNVSASLTGKVGIGETQVGGKISGVLAGADSFGMLGWRH